MKKLVPSLSFSLSLILYSFILSLSHSLSIPENVFGEKQNKKQLSHQRLKQSSLKQIPERERERERENQQENYKEKTNSYKIVNLESQVRIENNELSTVVITFAIKVFPFPFPLFLSHWFHFLSAVTPMERKYNHHSHQKRK